MIEDFCVFILTHGRPDNVITYRTLEKCGYTGPVFIIIDNEDKTADRYRENFGEKVIVFDKAAIAQTFDEGDNFGDRRAIVYARNACFDIARGLGFRYFVQLDDDYYDFMYRFCIDGKLRGRLIKQLDTVFINVLELLKTSEAKSVAFAQGGDFIGGDPGGFYVSLSRRKAMNSFFCDTNKPFQFVGRLNEDVNTYTATASRGEVFYTVSFIQLDQKDTQTNRGGMTDIYLASGTYVKSFYSVMMSPSSVKVGTIRDTRARLHHSISWKHAVPQIIEEKYRRV